MKMNSLREAFRAFRLNLRQRGALIASGLVGSNDVVSTTYHRAKNMVAPVDVWNADYWFDEAAAAVLEWYMSDATIGHMNFHGTEWEDEAHYPDGREEDTQPVWDKEIADRILGELRDALLEDPNSPYSELDFDYLDEGALAKAGEQQDLIEDRKQRARERFTSLIPALWD